MLQKLQLQRIERNHFNLQPKQKRFLKGYHRTTKQIKNIPQYKNIKQTVNCTSKNDFYKRVNQDYQYAKI